MITHDNLIKLIKLGVLSKVPEQPGEIEGALNGGNYLGRPGKDIFFAFSDMNQTEMKQVAEELAKVFPKEAPGGHVGFAACIRYIYGQFEKQGTLRSDEDFDRMKKEGVNWDIPRTFLTLLWTEFEKNENYYGLTILSEMAAHRFGDEWLLTGDLKKRLDMEESYLKSYEYAKKCNSYKQMFTPFYWAAQYFIKAGITKTALEYCFKTIQQAEKHCPDSRKSYVEKLTDCISYIKNNDRDNWDAYKREWRKPKNVCVKKAFSKYK